jgi:hypothetical protein
MKVAFTTCTKSYLGDAETLRESLLTYQPDYSFYIFLVDKNIEKEFLKKPYIVDIKTIGIPELNDMYDRYNYLELCCALKPFAGYFLLQQETNESVLYFDTDVLILNSLKQIEENLQLYDIALTPHNFKDEHVSNERLLVKSGLANGGFFGVKNTDNGKNFLHWWKDKTFDQGYFNLFKDMYSDQLWLTFAPFYFDRVAIIRNPGMNVAMWNLKYRPIVKKGDSFFVNEIEPLIFFHFSGFKLDINKKTYSYFPLNSIDAPTRELLDKYYELLIKNKSDSFLVKFDKKNKKVSKGPLHSFKIQTIGKLQVIMKNFSAYLETKR